jgi:hypothetical protein
MKKSSQQTVTDTEPMGIVISRGARGEQAPMVLAYVWGPAPEIIEEPSSSKAA